MQYTIRDLASLALAPVEYVLRGRANGEPVGPILIVGCPRSGTTLLSQLMTTCFQVSYISNAAYRYYRTPLSASWKWRDAILAYQSSFSSDYGRTKGPGEPNEADRFWKQWFPKDERPVDADYLSPRAIADMRAVICGLERILGGPFVNKHVGHSVRMRAFARAFSNVRFLWVQRDPLVTARSILKARHDRVARGRQQQVEDWWSARPREIDRLLGRPVLEQVCGQVYYINRNIEEDAATLGGDRCLALSYEQLCTDPRGELERICAWLEAAGIPLRQRGEPPEQFRVSTPSEQDAALMRELKDAWDRLTSSIGAQ
jgi:hypothetical protein